MALQIKCRIFDVDVAFLCTISAQIFGHKRKTNVNILVNKVKKKNVKPVCITTLYQRTKQNF